MADIVLMLRCVHGDSLHTNEFGVVRKLYAEDIKPWCLMAREKKWFPQSMTIEYEDSFQSRHEFVKIAATYQRGWLPVEVTVSVPPDFFLHMRNLHNEFRASMCTWKAGKNNRGRYRACWSCPHPVTWNCQMFRQMWRTLQIWWVLGYVQASKTAVKPQKNNSFSFNYNKDLNINDACLRSHLKNYIHCTTVRWRRVSAYLTGSSTENGPSM